MPLDEVGLAQAEDLADRLAKRGVDRLWSSDLSRAADTASVVSRATGVVVELDPRLREFNVGERQGLTAAEFSERFPDAAGTWVDSWDDALIPGAESIREVRSRVSVALSDCRAALAPGQTGVVLMHGAALRVALFDLLGWSWEHAQSLRPIGNCAWAEVHIGPAGTAQLASYNVSC